MAQIPKTTTKTKLKKAKKKKMRYWVCLIGETDWHKLPNGADGPMRSAVSSQFKKITGHYSDVIFSGWSADKKTVGKMLKAWKAWNG